MATFAHSTFSHSTYAANRPTYPPHLYTTLLTYHHGPTSLAIDLGSGHGLVTRALSPYFTHVIGADPSPGMISQAKGSTPSTSYSNVSYQAANAEELSFLHEGKADMVVAAQAAHWFDYGRFWPEMARVVRRGGTVAFWGYTDCVFVDCEAANGVLREFADGMGEGMLGPYWSQPGRGIVERRYEDVVPPDGEWEGVERREYVPGMKGRGSGQGEVLLWKRMRVREVKMFVRTWSAYHGWRERWGKKGREEGGEGDVVDEMFEKMREVEGSWRDGGEGWEDKEVEVEWGSGLVMARRRRDKT